MDDDYCGWELHNRYYTTGCGEEVVVGIYVLEDLGWTFCPHCGSQIKEESSE